MYAPERQAFLVEWARERGRVDVAGVAAELDVTPETVRRDLTALEAHGLLRRVHGGAIPIERLGFEPGVAVRAATCAVEKERIAMAALAELPREGTVLVDAGTTTARLADLIPVDRRLTVVTNALPIAMVLAARPSLTVLLLGGRVRGRTLAAVDTWAVRSLEQTYVDVAFVGTNGISPRRGLTTADPAEAAVKARMIASARRTIVLADHTKVGNDHFARFGELADIDIFITDDGLAPGPAEELAAAGLRVVRARPGRSLRDRLDRSHRSTR